MSFPMKVGDLKCRWVVWIGELCWIWSYFINWYIISFHIIYILYIYYLHRSGETYGNIMFVRCLLQSYPFIKPGAIRRRVARQNRKHGAQLWSEHEGCRFMEMFGWNPRLVGKLCVYIYIYILLIWKLYRCIYIYMHIYIYIYSYINIV